MNVIAFREKLIMHKLLYDSTACGLSLIRETNDSEGYDSKRIKLDQIMKLLFKLSDESTLNLINYMFKEQYVLDQVTLQYDDPSFIDDEYEQIVGDYFVSIKPSHHDESLLDTANYHIEFQTLNDAIMATRMFKYGLEKALSKISFNKDSLDPAVTFPKQLVIYLEQNNNIADRLTIHINLPAQHVINYTIPIMKYWEHHIEDLYQHQLYALLPLQVFQYRKPIQSIYNSHKSDFDKSRLISEHFMQLKHTIRTLVDFLRKGYEDQHISPEELKILLAAIQHLNDYLYTKYGEYETIEKEAYHMIKVLDDQRVMQQGIEQGIEQGEQRKAIDIAKNLLSKGIDLNLIVEATGLTHADVELLQRS